MTLVPRPEALDPRVLELRNDFDAAFSAEPPLERASGVAVLALTVGGDLYALKASEIVSLARNRRMAPLPQAPIGFAGLCGARGQLLPVWDLAALLGYPAGAKAVAPWLVVVAGEDKWALAFDEFNGYLAVASSQLCPYSGQGPSAPFARQAAQTQAGLRPVIELELLLVSILSKTSTMRPRRT